MHYFVAATILSLTVLPAGLYLAAGMGYIGALLPLRNWEMLIFLVGATTAGSWYALTGKKVQGSRVGAGFPCPGRGDPAPTSFEPTGPWPVLPWLFLISAMVSTLASGADLYQFWSMQFMALLAWLMVYCGLTRHVGAVREPPRAHRDAPLQILIGAIQIAALLNAGMAIAQFWGFNPFFKPITGGRPVTGFFDNPNHLGAFMAIALPLFFVGARSQRSAGQPQGVAPTEHLRWVGAALVGLAVLMSRSVFAILAMCASLVYYIIRRDGSRTAPTLIRRACFVGVALILLISILFIHPLSRANLLRWEIAKKSVAVALERPILGHGLGQYAQAFNARPPKVFDPPRQVTHAHNEYLELFVEQGLSGLAILGLFLWQIFKNVGADPRVCPGAITGDRPYRISLQASLIALMVNALGFYPLHVPLIALTAAIIMAGITGRHRGLPLQEWPG